MCAARSLAAAAVIVASLHAAAGLSIPTTRPIVKPHGSQSSGATTLVREPPSDTPQARNAPLWRAEKLRTRRFEGFNVPVGVKPPMLVVSRGCSGTTALGEQLHGLMAAHGVEPYTGVHWEAFWPGSNRFYNRSVGMAQAAIDMAMAATEEGKRLVVKVSLPTLDPDTAAALVAMNTRVALSVRGNALDWLSCSVRDCFIGNEDMYSVDSAGQKSDLCYQRRFSNKSIKAFFEPEALVRRLDGEMQYAKHALEQLAELGFNAERINSFTFEDLFMYESNGSGLETSTAEWKKLLSSLGVRGDSEKIESILRPRVGSHQLDRQSAGIFNFADVRKALIDHGGQAAGLLRDEV